MQFNVQNREIGKRRRKISGALVSQRWNELLEPIREAPTGDNPTVEGINDVSEAEKMFFALAQAVEQRDLHTASHCERLAFIAVAMGIVSGMERSELLILHRGGYMHDIGKVGIPDSILFKPGRLTQEEFRAMTDELTRGSEKLPILPPEATERASFYEDRW